MSGRTTRPGPGRRAGGAERVAELETELEMVRAQRLRDQARLGEVTKERDRLRFELAQRNAEDAKLARASSGHSHSEDDDEDALQKIDGWLIKAGAERARLRDEAPFPSTLLSRLTANLVLRFARVAARDRRYATAEVLYQALILLRPRGFVWRQAGNMLAGQGLFSAATDCFERAIQIDAMDAQAWHAKAMALVRLGDADASKQALDRAVALDPGLANRAGE